MAVAAALTGRDLTVTVTALSPPATMQFFLNLCLVAVGTAQLLLLLTLSLPDCLLRPSQERSSTRKVKRLFYCCCAPDLCTFCTFWRWPSQQDTQNNLEIHKLKTKGHQVNCICIRIRSRVNCKSNAE